MGDGTAVKEAPGFAVGIDGPTANHARIKEIKPLLARPIDLPVRFSDQHCLPLVDRDLVRTDLNLEWQDVFPWLWSLRPLWIRLRAHRARSERCGRAEQSDNLLGDLTGGRLHIQSQRIFVRIRFLKGIDLALQQACRHEMAAAPCQALGDEVSAAVKVDEPYFRPITDDDLAIGSLERGAGNYPRLLVGTLNVDPSGHLLEPRLSVCVRERNSCLHLGNVCLRVKRVALLEAPAEARSQFSCYR